MASPRYAAIILLASAILATACGLIPSRDTSSSHMKDAASPMESPMDAARLAKVKAALPKVAFPKLQDVLTSDQTYWYDHDAMKPSYQAAILETPPWGVNSNDKWFETIADSVRPTAQRFYDTTKKRWRFPFSTTAGTDDTTNIQVVNFLWLPAQNGQRTPIVTYAVPVPVEGYETAFKENSWGWRYPVNAMVGEVIFLRDGDALLPSEIRLRTRYASGWATNAFRPFPTAVSLSNAVKQRRPNWPANASLKALVSHLEDPNTLTPKKLESTQIPGLFSQQGAVDVLPDFGDVALVRELLQSTTFVAAYNVAWKTSQSQGVAYAATSQTGLSIVPKNYDAGVLAVNEDSCMRCHKETGRQLASFGPGFQNIVLYGEVWGRDGIFSFHPFDESQYNRFWLSGTQDNRQANPALKQQGIIVAGNPSSLDPSLYPKAEIIGHSPNGGDVPATNSPTSTNNGLVEFHIPAGTGAKNWNNQNAPVHVTPGQTLRLINDDASTHAMHTDADDPCPHGNDMRQGAAADCPISPQAKPGTLYQLRDHYNGGVGKFWIQVD